MIMMEKNNESKKYKYVKDNNLVLFWAPNINWKITENNQLKIHNYVFNSKFAVLFPTLYFITIDGIKYKDLCSKLLDFDLCNIEGFLKFLIEKHLLIYSIQSINDLFIRQSKLFNSNNSIHVELKDDIDKMIKYTKDMQERVPSSCLNKNRVSLNRKLNINKIFSDRKSVRSFNYEKIISLEELSSLLILYSHKNSSIYRYYYPSAGAFYPIDCYIYVKKNRIEDLDEGIYYYHPHNHELIYILCPDDINEDVYYSANKDIFRGSAISIYYIFDMNVSVHKYGDMSYYFGLIDAGAMAQTLLLHATEIGFGGCIIGSMNFEKIKHNFLLSDNQQYLFGVEMGLLNY